MELDINGAKILFTLPIDLPVLGPLRISETMVVSWIVMILITGFCIWLTHDLKEENISKRQALAEMLVEMANKFVVGNMGEKFRYMIPFVATFCNKCGIEPDQSCGTSKSDFRPVDRGSVGSRGIYHDHRAEDQDQWFRWISQRIYTADSGHDTI